MRPISPRHGCALVAALLVLAAACAPPPPPTVYVGTPQAPVVPPAVTASAAPSAIAAPPAAPQPVRAAPPSAWTDPEAVALLAADCAWAPAESEDGPSGLACTHHAEQTCNYNECDAEEERCLPHCLTTCDGCAAGCVKGCAACKSACKDDACQRACAVRCGGCRQACVKAKDRCTSGECGTLAQRCGKKLFADWQASKCDRLIPKLQACVEICVDGLNTKFNDDVPFMELIGCQNACENSEMPQCYRFHSYYRIY